MPPLVDHAIVLRCWEFSETSQTVVMLCRGHGVLRGLAKGARREKSPFSGGFEPLTRGQIVALVKPGSDLATLTEWDLRRVYWASRRTWLGHRAAVYLIDAIRHAITDADPHAGLFDALHAALLDMETTGNESGGDEAGILRSLLIGQWALLVETGYRPRLGAATVVGGAGGRARGGPSGLWFVPDGGAIVSGEEAHQFRVGAGGGSAAGASGAWAIRPGTAEALRRLAEVDDGTGVGAEGLGMALRGLDARTLLGANRLLAAYLREVLGREIPAGRWLVAGGGAGPLGSR